MSTDNAVVGLIHTLIGYRCHTLISIDRKTIRSLRVVACEVFSDWGTADSFAWSEITCQVMPSLLGLLENIESASSATSPSFRRPRSENLAMQTFFTASSREERLRGRLRSNVFIRFLFWFLFCFAWVCFFCFGLFCF